MRFSLLVLGLLLIAGLANGASRQELEDENTDLTPAAAVVSPRHGHHHHDSFHHHDFHKHFHHKHKHFHHKHHAHYEHYDHYDKHHDHHHHHHHPLLIKKKKKLILFKIKKLLPHHHVLHIPHVFHHFHDKHKHHHHKKHHHHWRSGFHTIDSSSLIPVYPGLEGQDHQLFNPEGGQSYVQLIADEPTTPTFSIPSEVNYDQDDQFEQDAKLDEIPNEEEENYAEFQLEEPDSQPPYTVEELNSEVPPLYFYAPQQVDYGRSLSSTTTKGKRIPKI